MSGMSDRDRKLMMLLVPIAVIVGYWFLLLAPQRQDASKAATELTKQEEARDSAVAKATQLETAKATFAVDYETVVRLGKAIPTKLDMASLIVQLDSAAKGTGIRFDKVAAGENSASAATPPGTTQKAPASPSDGSSSKPADAGGTAAQSTSGKAAETANNTATTSNSQAKQADSTTDTTTSTSSGKGLPVGGGSASPSAPATPGACAPGLECVPLDFEFRGTFFDLADFFHKLKRFVKVVSDDKLSVKGRLMTVDGFKFSTEDTGFPKLKAEVRATVYLSPKTEGATAGATPAGPAPGTSQSASTGNGPSALPTATATPN